MKNLIMAIIYIKILWVSTELNQENWKYLALMIKKIV